MSWLISTAKLIATATRPSRTDDHPGKDSDGNDIHLVNCADLAKALADCLEKNETYYEKPLQEDENPEETEQLYALLRKL